MKKGLLKNLIFTKCFFAFMFLLFFVGATCYAQTGGVISFEDGSVGGFSGGGGSVTETVTNVTDIFRTGTKSLKLTTTSTSSNKYWQTYDIYGASSGNTPKQYVHLIYWAKATGTSTSADASMRYASSAPPSGNGSTSNGTIVALSNVNWTRVAFNAGGANGRYYFPALRKTNGAAESFYIDDVVMYVGGATTTDVDAPNQPSSVAGTYSSGNALLTWASGGDNAATGTTGVQATMVLKYTGTGTATAPTLNQQASYANNDVIATDWKVVKNDALASETDLNIEAISSTSTYAVYHRDLAYNWSSGVLITVPTTLPITLSSFTASAQANAIALNWNTSAEINADQFIVERKTANSEFTQLTAVKANGYASSYNFKDATAKAGETYYYRLQLVDKDATKQSSAVVSARFGLQKQANISLYPNPANNKVTIRLPENNATPSNIKVSDSNGVLVLKSSIDADANEKELDISLLNPGIYFIKISNTQDSKTLKLVKH